MAKKKSSDITKSGPLSYRDIRTLNALNQLTGNTLIPATEDDISQYAFDRGESDETMGIMGATRQLNDFEDRLVRTPISQNSEGEDFWGNSFFDPDIAVGSFDIDRLSDIRAENQPWYSKLVNGIGKAGVLAGTTALETAGLLYGVGQGIYNAATNDESETGMGAGSAFLHGLWDNPITNALQAVNEFSEEWMPNYYTQDEQENPFSNIFTANFLGDKLLKNLGFMVGAFYGGIPASSLIGKAGTAAVKSARAASLAERAGMARRVRELTARYGDDVVGLNKALAAEHLTEAERGKRILEGFNKVKNAAQATRATTQTIGSLGSAINEGAIEAINNSKDWAKQQTQVANDEYQQTLAQIEQGYGGTEMETPLKMQAAEDYQKKLQEIELGRARMGNADLLLNIPVLMASNMYQLGKLYTRGFDSTRRQMGSFWNRHKLSGDLAKGTLKSDKNWKKGLTSAILKSNTEGLEEYLQRAASDGAGNAVAESIDRFVRSGQDGHAEEDVQDYIAGFGKAIATNLGDPNAWEEYMIGAVSSMFGMPVFGSQTKNAYIGKNMGFGFAGGVVGEMQDYNAAKAHEEQVAQYLNQRVKDPKFKALYDNLKKQNDYDQWLQEQIELGDKSEYKDLELEKFYQDLNAAASSGHLDEFKQLVGYNTDYTDDELEDIVKQTTRRISADDQRQQDHQRFDFLTDAIRAMENKGDALTDAEYNDYWDCRNELDEVSQRIQADDEGSQPYEDKLEGPFIDRNGQMNATDPDKMREILERNRNNLLQGIDDYLKIRNDIDIETDGNLDDNQIALLTQMKGKILDYEKRSAEMSEDLIESLGDVQERQEAWKQKVDDEVKEAQENYDQAKQHWEAVKKGKHNDDFKQKVEKQMQAAEKKLNRAKSAQRGLDNALKLLGMLTEEKGTTARERATMAKGAGEDFFDRLSARFDRRQKRNINTDEAQAILANPMNAMSLISIIQHRASELSNKDKQRLVREVVDLSTLANEKMAYNKKVREFMGDPEKINEAFQQAQDKVSQKEKDNKSDELSLNIREAKSMAELDRVLRGAYNVNPEIAQMAMQKAKQTADESTKNFIADYEKAAKFYDNFGRQTQKLPEQVAAGVVGTAASEWENALQGGVDVYDGFIAGMTAAAEELDNSNVPGAKETAAGIRQILSDLDAAKKSVATNKNTKKTSAKKDIDVEDDDASGSVSLAGFQAGLNRRKAKKGQNDTVKKDAAYFAKDKQEYGTPVLKRASGLGDMLDQRRAAKQVVTAAKAAEDKEDFYNRLRAADVVPYTNELSRIYDAYDAFKKGDITEQEFEDYLTPSPTKDTADDLQKAVEQEIRASKNKKGIPAIDDITKLSQSLKGRIQKYNEDNPDGQLMIHFDELLQRITDEAIADDTFNLEEGELDDDGTDLGEDNEGSDRAEKMHENLRVTFRSDHPTEFRIYDGRNLLEYRIPYEPGTEQLKAVQQLLKSLRAYQFVDNNYLGYVARAMEDKGKPVTIHLIRSTDDAINKDVTNPITFMAIKYDDEVENAIRKYGFGGLNSVNFSEKVRPVTINGERYQIIGVMSLNGEVAPEVSKAFSSLQGALNQELNPQIAAAKENGQPFVVSSKTTEIDTINTGRLDKKNGDNDTGDKVSLYDFMTSQQGDETRSPSSEWAVGMDFYFGTIVNGCLQITESTDGVENRMEEPNQHWMDKNNGAIVMFVPKADGKLYPVRVTRRTVREWLNADTDGSRIGQQLLEAILTGTATNKYLGNILNYLKAIYDDNTILADKMNAKMMLQKYFIFGKQSPVHFNDGAVTLNFGGREYNMNGDSFEEFAKSFFDALSTENIMFSLPSSNIEDINGREIIKSGIFEIGLRGFYNFNANFTVKAIDGEGNPVIVSSVPEGEGHFTGGNNMRATEMELDLGDGMKTYRIEGDGTVTLNGQPVSANVQNIVTLTKQAQQGTLPEAKMEWLSTRYPKRAEVRKFVADGIAGFDGVYVIHAEEDWVYDSRKGNHESRLYKISSEEGTKLMKEFNQAVVDFTTIPENIQAIKKLREASRTAPAVEAAPETPEESATPGVPSVTGGTVQGKQFSGKTIDSLNTKEGGLSALLISNSSLSFVKKVFAALQIAEDGGIPIDHSRVAAGLTSILEADKEERKQLLQDLLNEINGCNS